jgi:hypothetical protein
MAETTIAGIQPALPYYALTPHTVHQSVNYDITTYIVFLANQLYLISIGISPLVIIHLRLLQQSQVRSIFPDNDWFD